MMKVCSMQSVCGDWN